MAIFSLNVSAHLGLNIFEEEKVLKREVGEKVKRIVMEGLGVRPQNVVSGAELKLNLGADSLSFVEICIELEKEFNLDISSEDWEKVVTVQQAIDLVWKIQSEGSSRSSVISTTGSK